MKSPVEAPEKYDYEDCRMPRTAAQTGCRIPEHLKMKSGDRKVVAKQAAE